MILCISVLSVVISPFSFLILLILFFSLCFLMSLMACQFYLSEKIININKPLTSLYFFQLITEEGFLIPPCYTLELCILMGISFLFSSAFTSFLFTAICKASSDNHFAFLHFFSLRIVLFPASCTMSQTSVHSPLGTLSDLIPWIYCIYFKECRPVILLNVLQFFTEFPHD